MLAHIFLHKAQHRLHYPHRDCRRQVPKLVFPSAIWPSLDSLLLSRVWPNSPKIALLLSQILCYWRRCCRSWEVTCTWYPASLQQLSTSDASHQVSQNRAVLLVMKTWISAPWWLRPPDFKQLSLKNSKVLFPLVHGENTTKHCQLTATFYKLKPHESHEVLQQNVFYMKSLSKSIRTFIILT